MSVITVGASTAVAPKTQTPAYAPEPARPLASGHMLIGGLIAIALLGVLSWTGDHPAPRAQPAEVNAGLSLAEVLLVEDYYGSVRADDPLLTLADGSQVKESNYRGVLVNGRRVYYRATPHISMDPWTRGAVAETQVVVLTQPAPTSDFPLMIYTLR